MANRTHMSAAREAGAALTVSFFASGEVSGGMDTAAASSRRGGHDRLENTVDCETEQACRR
jgi:hypothetical protein